MQALLLAGRRRADRAGLSDRRGQSGGGVRIPAADFLGALGRGALGPAVRPPRRCPAWRRSSPPGRSSRCARALPPGRGRRHTGGMILSRGRRYIFVHIPKTGGTALSLALEARAMKDDILIGDTPKARARRRRLKGVKTAGRLWKHSTLADIDGLVATGEIAAALHLHAGAQSLGPDGELLPLAARPELCPSRGRPCPGAGFRCLPAPPADPCHARRLALWRLHARGGRGRALPALPPARTPGRGHRAAARRISASASPRSGAPMPRGGRATGGPISPRTPPRWWPSSAPKMWHDSDIRLTADACRPRIVSDPLAIGAVNHGLTKSAGLCRNLAGIASNQRQMRRDF